MTANITVNNFVKCLNTRVMRFVVCCEVPVFFHAIYIAFRRQFCVSL